MHSRDCFFRCLYPSLLHETNTKIFYTLFYMSYGQVKKSFGWDSTVAVSPHEVVMIAVWASYQIRKIAGCACTGNAGNVFPRRRFQRKLLVSDHGMHHGTCVTHVPWCMSGSLTCGDGENVPGIPGACAPAILRIWQEAHYANEFVSLCTGNTKGPYSISQEICTRFCCALLCCGYAIVYNEFTWSIYPYSSGLLCWHWSNR